ncbi:hypothetical protein FACS189499_03670 [Clostridia bacterium]|nr:hypothetical protein FACS189499_03670 [Clostridia bacterium]
MRTYYSEFVKHCMTFYTQYPYPCFRSDADKKNWFACDNALKNVKAETRDIILDVYLERRENFSESVSHVAKLEKMNVNSLWKIVEDFERIVAKKRGLL